MGEDPGFKQPKTLYAHAITAGVTIACHSDAVVLRLGDNARAIEMTVVYSMSPVQALSAATATQLNNS